MNANQAAVQAFQAPQQDAAYTGNLLVTILPECTIFQEIEDIVLDMNQE
jgi:hypothetical protein